MILLDTHDVQRSEIVTQILHIYGSSNLHDVQSFDSIQTDNDILQYDSSNNDAALIPKNKLPKNNFNNDSAL